MIGRKEWDQWNKITAEFNEQKRKQKEESMMKKCPVCAGEIENKKLDGVVSMKAGRELDALIAVNVMGWTLEEGPGTYLWRESNGIINTPSFYSTNIADAWLVVERMEDYGFDLHLDSDKRGYYCEFSNDDNSVIVADTQETAPMAICIAALKACGVSVDG